MEVIVMKKLLMLLSACMIIFLMVSSVRGSGRPEDEIVDHVKELISRYKQGDREAYDLLIVHIDEKLFPVYLEALRDTDAKVRRLAIMQLARYKNKEAIAPIAQLLKDDASEGVRREAAFRLGLLTYPESSRFLIETLNDDSQRVVKAAIRALGKLKSKEAIEPLKEKLKGDNEKDWEIQRAAAYALREITGKDWSEGIHDVPPGMRVRDEELTFEELERSIGFLRNLGGLIENTIILEELTPTELFNLAVPNHLLWIKGCRLKRNAQLHKGALERALLLRKLGEMTAESVKDVQAAYNEARDKYIHYLANSSRSD